MGISLCEFQNGRLSARLESVTCSCSYSSIEQSSRVMLPVVSKRAREEKDVGASNLMRRCARELINPFFQLVGMKDCDLNFNDSNQGNHFQTCCFPVSPFPFTAHAFLFPRLPFFPPIAAVCRLHVHR